MSLCKSCGIYPNARIAQSFTVVAAVVAAAAAGITTGIAGIASGAA